MEMIKKYDELYNKHLVVGKDVESMKLWGELDKKEFHYLCEHHQEIAKIFLEKREVEMEAKHWDNYVSRLEAEVIMSEMTPKSMWTVDQIKEATKQLGVVDENMPKWNCYSLVVTMNMIYSDHKKSIEKCFKDEELVVFVYDQAVETLEDQDGVFRIREYFEHKLK